MQTQDFVELIITEMKKRKMSLRRLALKAKVSQGKLSEVLRGKRPLSAYYINKLSVALSLGVDSQAIKGKKIHAVSSRPDRILKEQELSVLTQWHHLAILNLLKTREFVADSKWIADRLAISVSEAAQAIKTLKKLGLIEVHGDRLLRTSSFLSTPADIPSSTIKAIHIANIEKILETFPRVPVEYRDISHVTMAVSLKNMTKAKQEIRRFRKRMSRILETDEVEEVYALAVQLVPLTRLQKNY